MALLLQSYSSTESPQAATLAQRADACVLMRSRLIEIVNPAAAWRALSDPAVAAFLTSALEAITSDLLAADNDDDSAEALSARTPSSHVPPPLDVSVSLARALLRASAVQGSLDARAWVAWRRVCQLDYELSFAQVEDVQRSVEHGFVRHGHARPTTAKRRMSRTRMAMIGGAAVVGGGLLAASAAASAPLLAGAALAVHATGTAAVLGSTAGVTAMAGTLGFAGATRTGYKMARRTGGLREFELVPVVANEPATYMAATLGISGWLETDSVAELARFWDLALPEWTGAREALMFDRKELVRYGHALQTFIKENAVQNAAAGALVVAGGAAGASAAAFLTLPMVALMAQDVVDSPFAVAKNKAKLAGQELARALAARALGRRPVNLVGFGFGACCAFYCLEALAEAGETGLVADVCLFGAPMRPSPARWQAARRAAAGALANFYNPNDTALKFLMRVSVRSSTALG